MPGKRVQFDDETWLALDMLARDRMMDFQELADEAFRETSNSTVVRPHARNFLCSSRLQYRESPEHESFRCAQC